MTISPDMAQSDRLRKLVQEELAEVKRLHAYNVILDQVLTANPLRVRDVLRPNRAKLLVAGQGGVAMKQPNGQPA